MLNLYFIELFNNLAIIENKRDILLQKDNKFL